MRKKIRWMLIGTLAAAAVCLACGVFKIISAAEYIRILGGSTGEGPMDAALYITSEGFAPVGTSFILLACSCILYAFMHLGKRSERKDAQRKSFGKSESRKEERKT